MAGERVLQASAVIDLDDRASGKFDQIAKKMMSLSRLTETVGRVQGFQAFDRVARGLERSATAADALDRSVAAIGRVGQIDRMAQSFDRTARSIRRTTDEAKRFSAATAIGTAAGIVGAKIGEKAAGSVGAVVSTYRDFDDKRRYQKAILGLTDEQQKPFIEQALRMGAHTPYNDIQVLEAQLDLAQRGVDQRFIRPIVEMASDYAQAMNARLPDAAKTIEGILFSTGKHMEDMDTALKVAQRAVDFSVKLGKIGGLDDEDIKQFFKYGGQPGSVAGFSDPVLGAMAALMRRSNIRGDEAGVAVRSFASHLVAPTKTGMAALQAMGVDYNRFVKTPGAMSPTNLDMMVATTFGRHLTDAQKSQLGALLSDGETIGNREEFISKVTGIVGETFDKTKKGELKASDSAKIAKVAAKFWQMSLEGIDVQGLLRAVIAANPTMAQANAVFGQQQGGRFMSIGGKLELFDDYVSRLEHVVEGFAHDIGEQRMAGFSGALTRAEGAVKNFETAIGRANDSWATKSLDAFSDMLNRVSKFGDEAVRAGTALAALAASSAALRALQMLPAGARPPPGALAFLSRFLVFGTLAEIAVEYSDRIKHPKWMDQTPAEALDKLVHPDKTPEEHRQEESRIGIWRKRMGAAEVEWNRSPLPNAGRSFDAPSLSSFLGADPGELDPSVIGAQALARLGGARAGAAAGPSVRDLTGWSASSYFGGGGDELKSFPADLESALKSGLSGTATVTIEARPGPMLEPYVRGIVKSELKNIDVTGPGSVGTDGTNIDQHN